MQVIDLRQPEGKKAKPKISAHSDEPRMRAGISEPDNRKQEPLAPVSFEQMQDALTGLYD